MLRTTLFLLLLAGCSSHLSDAALSVKSSSASTLPATVPAGTVILSPGNTRITFVGSALMMSHEGTFTRFNGQLKLADGPLGDAPLANIDPAKIHLFVRFDMNSVLTEIPLLTRHLEASDFFDAARYPDSTFESTQIQRGPVGGLLIDGNLTLHGVTRAISFPAELHEDAGTLRFTASLVIRQSDFGMNSAGTTTDAVPVKVEAVLESAH